MPLTPRSHPPPPHTSSALPRLPRHPPVADGRRSPSSSSPSHWAPLSIELSPNRKPPFSWRAQDRRGSPFALPCAPRLPGEGKSRSLPAPEPSASRLTIYVFCRKTQFLLRGRRC